MRWVLLAALLLPGFASAEVTDAATGELPNLGSSGRASLILRDVTLTTGGVAQLGFSASVGDPARLALTLPLDQVDDVLASLEVDDPAGGLPSLGLPGRTPLSQAFRSLPFGPSALGSAEALLGALVGVGVRAPQSGIAGRVLSVTAFTDRTRDGVTITRHRLAVATSDGIASVVLEDVPDLALDDPALRAQIGAALDALAAARAQDSREVEVALPGAGQREIRLSYLIAAPVWKPTWRLRLAPDGPARLQGFAVVENLTGQDWNGVHLTLMSGDQVLYRQPLYDPVLVSRPVAPVPVARQLAPRPDAGGAVAMAARAMPLAPAPAPMMAFEQGAPGVAAPPPPPAVATQAVAAVRYSLAGPVTASAGRTVLVPFLDASIPARRIALVQPGTDSDHPLVAVQVTNGTGAALPPGLVALTDADGFAGEAQLPTVTPGDTRLLAFAADLAVMLRVERSDDERVVGVRAARGTLEIIRREVSTTTYRLRGAPGGAVRTVLIEQPKRQGWTLAEPQDGVEDAREDWRIARPLPAGADLAVRVVLQQEQGQRVALLDQAPDSLLALASTATLGQAQRAALQRAAELRTTLDHARAAEMDLRRRADAVVADQGRLRANLGAVPANSALQQQYLRELADEESRLAKLRAEADQARADAVAADAALRDYLANLTL
jgi:hypothetical protein